MQYLTRLTPAEISCVARHKNVSLQEVAKMTFFHLVIKGVLQIRTETRMDRRRNRERVFEYVLPGPAYTTYPAKPHERLFLELFMDERQKQGLLLRYFIRLVYQKAIVRNQLIRKIARSENMVSFLAYPKLTGWSGLFFKLSDHGKMCKTEITRELESVKERFVVALKEERFKAVEIAAAIGGNLLLIHPLDSELSSLFDGEMAASMQRRTFTDDVTEAFWWSNFGDSVFDVFTDSFDSDYHAAENSWDVDSGWDSDSSGDR